jgi:hypothetical protein
VDCVRRSDASSRNGSGVAEACGLTGCAACGTWSAPSLYTTMMRTRSSPHHTHCHVSYMSVPGSHARPHLTITFFILAHRVCVKDSRVLLHHT